MAIAPAELARRVRRHALTMVHAAKSSHIGTCLSMTDILAVLYSGVLRVDPAAPRSPTRDRLVVSKGPGPDRPPGRPAADPQSRRQRQPGGRRDSQRSSPPGGQRDGRYPAVPPGEGRCPRDARSARVDAGPLRRGDLASAIQRR
ncbi:MAG: hypothetical protein FJ206_06435 [Gemmatimonadetes bacterium]|nr:hypothetical protein [Gemmatimonadota bacterium]